MATLEERQRYRKEILRALYDATEGSTNKYAQQQDLQSALGFSSEDTDDAYHYLQESGYVTFPTFGAIAITHEGVRKVEEDLVYREPEPILSSSGKPLADAAGAPAPGDTKSIFLVHGRDHKAAHAMRDLLRALGLRVIEWEQAVTATGTAAPYVGDVVLTGMRLARAVVILSTADDLVKLRPELATEDEDPSELEVSGQARPNVIYEAGISDALDRTRTVLVEIGRVKGLSDLAGRHVVRLDNSSEARHRLAARLISAGLDVDQSGSDWLRSGDFSASIEASKRLS